MSTPETKAVSMRADRLKELLFMTLLLSSDEVRAFSMQTKQQVKDDRRDLLDKDFVSLSEMGCLLPAVPRILLTPEGLEHFDAPPEQSSWHLPDGLGNRLLYHLPKVEAVNDIVRRYLTDDWPLWDILHFERRSMFAVAEHYRPMEDAYACVVFCWASLMDRERDLYHRIESLREDVQAQALPPGEPFSPSQVCIVAADEWSASRALMLGNSLLSDWVSPTNITAWYYCRGGWRFSDASSVRTGRPPTRLPPLFPTTGPLLNATSVAQIGPRRFDRIVSDSLWSGRAGHHLYRLLTLVGQYPVASLDHYKGFLGESETSTRSRKRLNYLKDKGLVEVVVEEGRASDGTLLKKGPRRWSDKVPMAISERGQGKPRYALTTAGRVLFCCAYGGAPSRLWTRTKQGSVKSGRWNIQHEDCGYDFLVQCYAMECSIAPGWEATITMADGNRIEPDGTVLVSTPKWGRTWCLLEVELSRRYLKEIQKRFEKYWSPHRQDEHPLLVVAYDEKAERNFHVAGAAHGLRMLTTTMKRLAEGGVFGPGVWSFYGDPVTLRA